MLIRMGGRWGWDLTLFRVGGREGAVGTYSNLSYSEGAAEVAVGTYSKLSKKGRVRSRLI